MDGFFVKILFLKDWGKIVLIIFTKLICIVQFYYT
jgi:hypothetical protein